MNEWIYLAYVSDNIRVFAVPIFIIGAGIMFWTMAGICDSMMKERVKLIKIAITIMVISGLIMVFLPSGETIQEMTVTEIPAKPNTEYAVNK